MQNKVWVYELYEKLIIDLEKAEDSEGNFLSSLQKKKLVATNYIKQLELRFYQLKRTKPEEVQFYKQYKPLFSKFDLLYTRLVKYYACYPIGPNSKIEAYRELALIECSVFFEANVSTFEYYRLLETHLDKTLFESKNPDRNIFCLIAFHELLFEHLQITSPDETSIDKENSLIPWPFGIANFVELTLGVYTLYRDKYPEITRPLILRKLSAMFKVKPGINISRKTIDIAERTDPCKLINQMSRNLQDFIRE